MKPDPTQRELEILLSENLASVYDREHNCLDRILAETGGHCVLFGAGSLGRAATRCLLQDGVRPSAFSDSNAALWYTAIEGVPVLPPEEAVSMYGTEAAFLVTIWTTGHRYADTCTKLRALGAKHVYPVAPVRWKYAEELLPFYCQDLPSKVYADAKMVSAAYNLWADDWSRQEYVRQIRYRALGDYEGLSAPDPEPSYFLDSLFSLRPDEIFLDCGAYNGDTIRELLRRQHGGFSKILAFEPDPTNFAALQRYLESLPAEVIGRITAYPYAVAAKRSRLLFNTGGDLSSSISQTGDISIDALPLDEIAQDLAPTFLKMDIEGAEVDALNGATQLISKHHPILSICLYHRQNDLWLIPLMIHSIYPGYRHFLRAHEEDGWQTVGYAIPPERLRPGVGD